MFMEKLTICNFTKVKLETQDNLSEKHTKKCINPSCEYCTNYR